MTTTPRIAITPMPAAPRTLPSFSRLVTPGTGVVAIVDGVVLVGNPATGKPVFINQNGGGLSQQVLQGLRGVLSPSVYSALLALIHGP